MRRTLRLALLLVAALPTAAGAADLAAVVERVRQGTVLVEVLRADGSRTGSGFFLERRGLIATALHTVEGARHIRVSVPGTYTASDARLLAASSTWDLALLEVVWPEDVAYPGLALDGGGPLSPGTEVAVTGFCLSGSEAARSPLTFRGIVSGTVPHRGGAIYVLDLTASVGLSGGPVYLTDNGSVSGVLTRVIANGGTSGPGGAVPAAILRDLVLGVSRAH